MFNDSTLAALYLGLDRSIQKQTSIALHIAHANRQEHRAREVDFAKSMDHSTLKMPSIGSNNNISLEEELAKSLENMTQYRALIKGVQYKFSLLKWAISGGNV